MLGFFTYNKRLYDQAQKNLYYQNLIMHASSSMTELYLAPLYVFKWHIQYQCAFCVFAEKKAKQNTEKPNTPTPTHQKPPHYNTI